MNIVLDRFSSMAEAMIKQGKNDLISEDDRLALQSAKYFFLKPAQGDDSDLKRFAGLCVAAGINVNAAAKAIFNELSPCQQKRIRGLLQNAGYYVQSEKLPSVK